MKLNWRKIVIASLFLSVGVTAAETTRSPMEWTAVHTNAIAQWKSANQAPSGVVVDVATRTVRILAEATGIGPDDVLEFFAIGPLSDRAYESAFVTVASPAVIAEACAQIGLPRGVAPDPLLARMWPAGEKVSLSAVVVAGGARKSFEELLSDQQEQTEGRILNQPLAYTGGARDAAGGVIAATNIPCAVFALYNHGPSLFQLNGAFDQSSAYGRFRLREKFAAGTLLELVVRWDGRLTVKNRCVELTATNAAEVLASLRDDAKKFEVFAQVAYGSDVTVAKAAELGEALSLVDGSGVKMNGAAEGEFFYRAFLPDLAWRQRAGRLFQPFEIHLAADGTRSFVFVEEDWSGEGLDPILKPRATPFKEWREVPALIAQTGEQGAKVSVAFVFAPKTMSVAAIRPIVRTLMPRINTFYVFGEEDR